MTQRRYAEPRPAQLPSAARTIRTLGALLLTASVLLWITPAAQAAAQTPPIPMKVLRYAGHLVARYDTDGDGRLDASEWSEMGDIQSADSDGDGIILAQELAGFIVDYGLRRRIRLMPAAEDAHRLPSLLPVGIAAAARGVERGAIEESLEPSGLEAAAPIADEQGEAPRRYVVSSGRRPQGLPAWFAERDLDGDGQLTQAEFSSSASPAALQQFRAYDLNSDGVITPDELLGPVRGPKPPDRP